MTAWLQLVLGLINIAGIIAKWLNDKQALDSASNKLLAIQLNRVLDDIKQAEAIRQAVAHAAAANPGSLREPDPNSRD